MIRVGLMRKIRGWEEISPNKSKPVKIIGKSKSTDRRLPDIWRIPFYIANIWIRSILKSGVGTSCPTCRWSASRYRNTPQWLAISIGYIVFSPTDFSVTSTPRDSRFFRTVVISSMAKYGECFWTGKRVQLHEIRQIKMDWRARSWRQIQ